MKSEAAAGLAKAQEDQRLREEESARRQAEEKRLAEARRAIEAEKTRLAQVQRAAEERAAAEAKAAREAAEKAAQAAAKKREEAEKAAQAAARKREEAERLAAEAELRRQAEEAEKRRLAAEVEKRRQAEARLEAERAKVKEYLVHVTLVCLSEGERDVVVRCLNERSMLETGDATGSVGNVKVVEYEVGRNLVGIVQKGYRVRCDLKLSGVGNGIRRPTDEARRILSGVLNEKCQLDGEDRIDWSSFTRMNCLQDFSTVSGCSGAQKNSASGVRSGF